MQSWEILNIDKFDRLRDDLEGWIDYIPLILLPYKERGYWQKCTDEAEIKFAEKRQGITGEDYLIKDTLEWIEEYPQFEYIINWEKVEEYHGK